MKLSRFKQIIKEEIFNEIKIQNPSTGFYLHDNAEGDTYLKNINNTIVIGPIDRNNYSPKHSFERSMISYELNETNDKQYVEAFCLFTDYLGSEWATNWEATIESIVNDAEDVKKALLSLGIDSFIEEYGNGISLHIDASCVINLKDYFK